MKTCHSWCIANSHLRYRLLLQAIKSHPSSSIFGLRLIYQFQVFNHKQFCYLPTTLVKTFQSCPLILEWKTKSLTRIPRTTKEMASLSDLNPPLISSLLQTHQPDRVAFRFLSTPWFLLSLGFPICSQLCLLFSSFCHLHSKTTAKPFLTPLW